MSTKAIAECLGALCVAFHREHTDALVKAYGIGLDGLDDRSINQATAKALQQCRFMPTPAELRELSGATTHTLASLVAWERLQHALDYFGKCQDPDKMHTVSAPILRAVLHLGGWDRLHRQRTYDKDEFFKWTRKDFLEIYPTFARDKFWKALPPPTNGKAIGVDLKRIGVMPDQGTQG